MSIRNSPELMLRKLWAVSPNPTQHGMPIFGRFFNRGAQCHSGDSWNQTKCSSQHESRTQAQPWLLVSTGGPHSDITSCKYRKQRGCSLDEGEMQALAKKVDVARLASTIAAPSDTSPLAKVIQPKWLLHSRYQGLPFSSRARRGLVCSSQSVL